MIECGDLRVVFDWHGDRFRHFVERRIAGHWTTVLESLEGASNDVWPSSPPLQTLHIEERPDGPVALLIGRAGSSHWSTSILALTEGGGFVFDLACRAQVRPVQLVATYRRLAESLEIITESGRSELTNIATGPSADLRIGPVNWPSSFPATVQWRYRIALAKGSQDKHLL
jgi:hypothetical protein